VQGPGGDAEGRRLQLQQVLLTDERPGAAPEFQRLFASDLQTGQTLTLWHRPDSNEVRLKVHQLAARRLPRPLWPER
jgi:hypothetical protein